MVAFSRRIWNFGLMEGVANIGLKQLLWKRLTEPGVQSGTKDSLTTNCKMDLSVQYWNKKKIANAIKVMQRRISSNQKVMDVLQNKNQ
jgi:hypothetical protein